MGLSLKEMNVPNGTSLIILLMQILLAPPSLSWVMPSPKFLEAFALKFQTEGIRVALPDEQSNRNGIPHLLKYFR